MDRGRKFEEVADEALTQIDANGYSERFSVSGKTMHRIGVVFSSEGKGIVGWKVKQKYGGCLKVACRQVQHILLDSKMKAV